MAGEQELRIGICSCTVFYNGQLQDKKVSFPGFAEPFRAREVVIPDNTRWESIHQNRIHFFLDLHTAGKTYDTELSLINLYPNKSGRDKLFIGMSNGTEVAFYEYWAGKPQPPTVNELLGIIPEIAMRQTRERIRSWLTRMTPPGWSRPEQITTAPSGLCLV